MRAKCIIDGCDKDQKYANGKCGMHWTRAYREGEKQSTVREFGTGSIGNQGYVVLTRKSRRLGVHVDVAEKAMGKQLPPGVIVHHVDEDRANNRNNNLVVCPNAAYHSLLHQRMKALNACGHAGWRKCWVCKRYDDPVNLYICGQVAHKACIKSHAAQYYVNKQAQIT